MLWFLKNYKENEINVIVYYLISCICNILFFKYFWDMCCLEIKYVN